MLAIDWQGRPGNVSPQGIPLARPAEVSALALQGLDDAALWFSRAKTERSAGQAGGIYSTRIVA